MIAILASGMRINVPGLLDSSADFPVRAVRDCGSDDSETIVLGAVMTLVQCYWNQPRRPRPAQVIFNVSSMAVATVASPGSVSFSLAGAHFLRPGHPPGGRHVSLFLLEHRLRSPWRSRWRRSAIALKIWRKGSCLVAALLSGRRGGGAGRQPRESLPRLANGAADRVR